MYTKKSPLQTHFANVNTNVIKSQCGPIVCERAHRVFVIAAYISRNFLYIFHFEAQYVRGGINDFLLRLMNNIGYCAQLIKEQSLSMRFNKNLRSISNLFILMPREIIPPKCISI